MKSVLFAAFYVFVGVSTGFASPAEDTPTPVMKIILDEIDAAGTTGDPVQIRKCLRTILSYEAADRKQTRRDRLRMFAALEKGARKHIDPSLRNAKIPSNLEKPEGVSEEEFRELRRKVSRDAERVGRNIQLVHLAQGIRRTAAFVGALSYGRSEEERAALERDLSDFEDSEELQKQIEAKAAGKLPK